MRNHPLFVLSNDLSNSAMSTQDKDLEKEDIKPLTGVHIAPKGHGAGCACCMPEEENDQ
ncbi:MAG TPA: hypothetical protein PK513_09290 [Alphaproteobacteria bacterium]|nr:hypothetical protein [Alphaproteobacteria bacterium]USO04977.1 MAG: hypothetical protein H6859_07385 [Rhodospirillales bacterium]HOO82684.1 hypothetical protein [Alphaproteobacteria bacterium]